MKEKYSVCASVKRVGESPLEIATPLSPSFNLIIGIVKKGDVVTDDEDGGDDDGGDRCQPLLKIANKSWW